MEEDEDEDEESMAGCSENVYVKVTHKLGVKSEEKCKITFIVVAFYSGLFRTGFNDAGNNLLEKEI